MHHIRCEVSKQCNIAINALIINYIINAIQETDKKLATLQFLRGNVQRLYKA
jgi:hypothetical protein